MQGAGVEWIHLAQDQLCEHGNGPLGLHTGGDFE
jgi:hypothetical protein